MPTRTTFAWLAIGCFSIAAGGVVWLQHEHEVEENRQSQIQKAQHEAAEREQARLRDQRLEQVAEKARRVLDEVPLFDLWPLDADLWPVKQITVADELKCSRQELCAELEAGLAEIVALTPPEGPEARLRRGQAGDIAFALFRLPQAERDYREAAMLADSARDIADSLRWKEKVAQVWHAARHFDDERGQREFIATLRANSGLADPAPLLTAAHTAMCLRDLGRYSDAVAVVSKVIGAEGWQLDPEHPELVVAVAVRAFLFHEMRRNVECERDGRRIFEECQRVYGPADPHTAVAEGRLTACLYGSQKFAEAGKTGLHAVQMCEQNYGKSHPLVGLFLRFAADALSDAGSYEIAGDLCQRGLEIEEKFLAPDSLDMGHGMARLGMIMERTNRLAEAQRYYRGAMEIYLKLLGPNSTFTLGVQGRLTQLQAIIGGDAVAVPKLVETNAPTEALAVEQKSRVLVIQAERLQTDGKLKEAEELFRQIVAMQEKVDPAGVEFSISLQNLGVCLERTAQRAEAEALFRRALAIEEMKLGSQHVSLIATFSHLADICLADGRQTEGERLLRRAADLCVANDRTKTADYAKVMNSLALLLQQTRRLPEALPIQRKVLESVELSFGKNNESYVQCMHNLATTLAGLQRTDEAEHLLEQAIAIGEKLQPESLGMPSWLTTLANIRARQHAAEAEQLYRRALNMLVLQSRKSGREGLNLQYTVGSYTNFLKTVGLTQGQATERINRLQKGGEVPELAMPAANKGSAQPVAAPTPAPAHPALPSYLPPA